MTLEELAKRSDDYVKKIEFYKVSAVKNSEEFLIELNKQQLSESKLSTGGTITPPYQEFYADFKGFPNPDLEVTGAFKRGMNLIVRIGRYFISSTDVKTPSLVNKYSVFIFGVFKKNLAMGRTTRELSKSYRKNVL